MNVKLIDSTNVEPITTIDVTNVQDSFTRTTNNVDLNENK